MNAFGLKSIHLVKGIIYVAIILIIEVPVAFAFRPACQFDAFATTENSRPLQVEIPNNEPIAPNIIWSKLSHIPARSPPYATFAATELSNVRINLMAGVVFDTNGCTSRHFMQTPELHNRLRFLPGLAPGPTKHYSRIDYQFDSPEVIYFGGSLHSRDWQHAVIDFLPMFDFALPYIFAKKNVTIVAGKYSRFFEKLFPFNQVRFVSKDYKYKSYQQFPIAPCFFAKKMLYIDILNRDQSYTRPNAYARVLPFLFGLSSNIGDTKKLLSLLASQQTLNSSLPNPPLASRQCQIVYFDRTPLLTDSQYIQNAGKILGRNVVNQDLLLLAISKALKPECELLVWTCKNWEVDRHVVRNATVLMGPHGGHFVNMIFSVPGTHIIEFGRSYTLRQLRNATGTGSRNARWVFAGMSSALGHTHWFIEDKIAVQQYISKKEKPLWSDEDIRVDTKQVIDTLKQIGVARQ